MILTPDEFRALYKEEIEPNLKKGRHPWPSLTSYSIHYNQVVPRADLDVIMITPKAPGHTVRSRVRQGGGGIP